MVPRRVAHYGLLIGLIGLLAVFLVYPIWLTVRGGFARDVQTLEGFTLEHIVNVFRDPVLREGLLNSATVAAGTTTLSILIALPLAVLSAGYRFPLKGLWNAIILVPLILPPFVGAIGLKMILGREGALNSLLGTGFDILGEARFWGVVAAQALSLYPIVFLNATAALANLDPALDEAAENLGIGPVRRFVRVTLPLIRPGLFAGGTIVFIWSFTELGTPLMFDYYTVTPVQVFNKIKEVNTSAEPYALVVVMLFSAMLLYFLGKGVFGRQGHAMYSKASRASAEKQLGTVGGMLAAGLFALVTACALMPHMGVVCMSFAVDGTWYQSVLPRAFTLDHYRDALGHPLAFGSIVMSLQLAAAAMLFNIVLGILIGYVIVRTKVRGRQVLDGLAMMPLAVPGLVMAFGFVAMSLNWPFGATGPLGSLVDVIGADPNPIPLLVIAYSVRRLPYIVRATVAGLEQTSGELEEAAVNLGASAATAVRRVIVPLIAANLIAGGLLVFSFAMLEVSDSLILAQQEKHYPITKAIYTFAERLGDGASIASAMGVWGMALLAVTMVGASTLLGKKLGAIFRV
ncbi:MAG: iron ABC transporter permease [Phycisphaerales bacterium]|nr:iron ABC transporter permease [Phycisphaerales bacterium]